MSRSSVLFVLFIRFLFCTCEDSLFNHSNCSLLFTVQTIDLSNIIATHFPIELIGDYNLTCRVKNLVAYYQTTPLDKLVVRGYDNDDENIESMIKLNSSIFRFNINQSSTIRLCVSSDDDQDRLICRQIHIGINVLYNFWNLPMKIVYIFLICSLGSYYSVISLRTLYRKIGKIPKSKSVPSEPLPIHNTNNDTFENEKVHEMDTSDDE